MSLEPKAIPNEAKAAAKDIEEAARATAEGAVARAVKMGAEKISRVVVERSQTTADNLTAKQKTWACVAGGGMAFGFIVIGALLAWLYIDAHIGICGEPPVRNKDGNRVCYVELVSG